MENEKKRCFGTGPAQELYARYHDEEWGRPVYDDQRLFEFLVLEGAQAGLSWETILKKREGYRQAFHSFNIENVSNMTEEDLENLTKNPNIIRNRLKIFSVQKNARVFLEIQKEFGSFYAYLWQFGDKIPHPNRPKKLSDIPTETPASAALSKDLKKRGMRFVGKTIMYAYMQAVGVVNDHLDDCWLFGSPHGFTPSG